MLKQTLALIGLTLSLSANAGLILQQVSPTPTDYFLDVDFTSMTGSGVGNVVAFADPIDWDLGLGNSSTSGCEVSDFSSFTAGNIALLQRGACTFRVKVENAILSGAAGALIFNQGDDSNRFGLANASLDLPPLSIPTLFTTYSVGTSLDDTVVRIMVPQTVPAPATLALFGLGLAGLGWSRRKKA